ncbi:NUDIX hydrolase [Candidatus Woesearchaeota archaeon]|nr:NUDIX hydrolase [Candidatus Woesearchaeota archaeon]
MNNLYVMGRRILAGCLVVDENNRILLLFRRDHKHYETPGGKVAVSDCLDPAKPKVDDFARAARRELFEELGNSIKVEPLCYLGCVDFKTPIGKPATSHKFLTKIFEGKPKINEPKQFSKLEYLPIKELQKYPISPDLRVLLPKLQSLFNSN